MVAKAKTATSSAKRGGPQRDWRRMFAIAEASLEEFGVEAARAVCLVKSGAAERWEDFASSPVGDEALVERLAAEIPPEGSTAVNGFWPVEAKPLGFERGGPGGVPAVWYGAASPLADRAPDLCGPEFLAAVRSAFGLVALLGDAERLWCGLPVVPGGRAGRLKKSGGRDNGE